jgi:hypothetical protein
MGCGCPIRGDSKPKLTKKTDKVATRRALAARWGLTCAHLAAVSLAKFACAKVALQNYLRQVRKGILCDPAGRLNLTFVSASLHIVQQRFNTDLS